VTHTGLFTSLSNEWATPQEFFDKLDTEFHFNLDPCATSKNAKCSRYFTQADDGLARDWDGSRVFVNPPYGHEISKWVRKSWEESQRGCLVVMLIPARTDTRYWHDYVMKADEIRFIRGRLYFNVGERTGRAPFPSAVVVFRPFGSATVPIVSTFLIERRRKP